MKMFIGILLIYFLGVYAGYLIRPTQEVKVIEVPTTPEHVIQMSESCYQQLQTSDKVHIIIHNDLKK